MCESFMAGGWKKVKKIIDWKVPILTIKLW
ncbi:hypothetical protein DFH72_003924 [Clostridium beijerinckii]|nr:hypothetical protein [Clostridium beijerinckii]